MNGKYSVLTLNWPKVTGTEPAVKRGEPVQRGTNARTVDGRFAAVGIENSKRLLRLDGNLLLNETISFHKFLERFFQERDAWKFPTED